MPKEKPVSDVYTGVLTKDNCPDESLAHGFTVGVFNTPNAANSDKS